jgi:carbamoyltransferase
MRLVLGISDTHNASAAAIDHRGGLFALQEERPTRIKNFAGFPARSIEWILGECGVAAADVDLVALAGHHQPPQRDREELLAEYRSLNTLRGQLKRLLRPTPVFSARKRVLRRRRLRRVLEMGFRESSLRFYEHHLCHAASAYYGWGKYDEPILVLTCDGGGDGLCATVSIGERGALRRLHALPWSESIAVLYALVTFLMGMVPLEHEYKIMGMAPYARRKDAERVAGKLEGLFSWPESAAPFWRRRRGVPHMYYAKPVLEAIFDGERFDAVMAGTQVFVERMLCELVRRAVRLTGLRKLALAGGIFMNVKANKEVLALGDVDDLYVFPSCGDETNAIGACYLARGELDPEAAGRLEAFYLGPEWNGSGLESWVDSAQRRHGLVVERPPDVNARAAELLARGEIVARFSGREEFGARSLGNRAILADPRNPEVVRDINDIVKNRDFWMPFAASINREFEARYLENPKRVPSPYMILSFATTEEGARSMRAGLHPYDRTCRPQVVDRGWNPEYWDLIDKFSRLTGVGGLLNTSLNLHGLPLAHRPDDALEVLLHSGLRHLAIGPFLVSKAPPAETRS